MTKLGHILEHKRSEIRKRFENISLIVLEDQARSRPKTRDFAGALQAPRLSLIAEVKRMSPSSGKIRKNFDPVLVAQEYEEAGAAAISVLTDERHFGGVLNDLWKIKERTTVPLLQKDFILEEGQIYEGRCAGADAVLLISSILEQEKLVSFCRLCTEIGLAALVEVHDLEDLEKALAARADIIGINNRNLQTFEVDLSVTERLLEVIPKGKIVVSESGIKTRKDVVRLSELGVDAILVGEALMKSPNIKKKVRELLGNSEL